MNLQRPLDQSRPSSTTEELPPHTQREQADADAQREPLTTEPIQWDFKLKTNPREFRLKCRYPPWTKPTVQEQGAPDEKEPPQREPSPQREPPPQREPDHPSADARRALLRLRRACAELNNEVVKHIRIRELQLESELISLNLQAPLVTPSPPVAPSSPKDSPLELKPGPPSAYWQNLAKATWPDQEPEQMRNRCLICFQKGHLTSRCPEPYETPEWYAYLNACMKTKACYNCGTPGHSANECPQPLDKLKIRSLRILRLRRSIKKHEQRGIHHGPSRRRLRTLRNSLEEQKKEERKLRRKQKRVEGWRKSAMNPKNCSLARPPLVRSQAITEREQAYCLTLANPSPTNDESEAYYADRAARMVDELTADADAKTEPPPAASHSNPLDDFLNFDFANSPPLPPASPDSWTWENPRWDPSKLLRMASPLE